MLKFLYEKEADIPAGMKEHYVEADGKWVLECEGAVPKARLDEFRKTNTDLKKKLEAFDGIDPEEHRTLVARKAEFEAGTGAGAKEKIEAEVSKRVGSMKEESDKKIAALESTTKAQREKLHALQIDQTMIAAATEMGLRKTATQDLISRARAVWRLGENDAPVAFTGEEQIYGKSGQPITPKEWLEALAKDATHLFEESKGGGAGGGGGGGTKGGGGPDTNINPWKNETLSLKTQREIFLADPERARRLASAAGKKIGP